MISILPFLALITIFIFAVTSILSLFYLMRKSSFKKPSVIEIPVTLFLLLSICFTGISGYFLYDCNQPNRIFNRYFGFQPNEAVLNLKGFDLAGYITNLEFQTNTEIVSLITSNGFKEIEKKDTFDSPIKVFELLKKPTSRVYKHELSSASYYLIYDQESGNAFFYLVSLD
jgi:hypothetical protein